jgi:AcrR family transcriptional regulator
MAARRLSAEDWIAAGLAALAAEGPGALRAEALARRLGTTKGSFYWHFKDVPAYHAALARHWEAASLTALTRAAEGDATPGERLQALDGLTRPDHSATGLAGLESAMRGWARANRAAADAVAEVDGARLAYITAVLAALGLSNPDFARLVYGAQIGLDALDETGATDSAGARSTLMAALTALEEA